jgi:hypothetical protein
MSAALRRFLVPVAVFAVAACSGFGAGDGYFATVTGTVDLDGVPLGSGHVEFRTVDGAGVLASCPIADGAFSVTPDARLAPGAYRIVVRSPQKSGRQIPAGSPFPPGTLVDEVVETLPDRYNDASVLRELLNSGANRVNLDLGR